MKSISTTLKQGNIQNNFESPKQFLKMIQLLAYANVSSLFYASHNIKFSLDWFLVFLISPLMQMAQAQVKLISSSLRLHYSPIQIHWNNLQTNMVEVSRANSKYKKVTIEDKVALMGMVKSGSSIINAACILKINYSTAKSIFQNIKTRSTKKRKRTHFVETDSDSQSQIIKQIQST